MSSLAPAWCSCPPPPVAACRYYHEVGLLDEPERRAHGYQRYGVDGLIQILRIKRLDDLGFSVAQMAAVGDVENGRPAEVL